MIITNSNIQRTRHEVMAFEGEWLASFGTPSPHGTWIIYGMSGSGKTTFALRLAKYLTQFGRVVYWSLEQGNTLSFQRAWQREHMAEAGSGVIVADDEETTDTIAELMCARRGRQIVIIDSLTPLRALQFDIRAYERWRKRMKGKLLIFLSHERQGVPDSSVGDYIYKLADLKMRVEGYRVMTNTRAGESLADYTIWKEGADQYWLENI